MRCFDLHGETPISNFVARRFPLEQRAQLAQCPLGKQLFELMAQKKTNLAVAADVPTVQEMLQLAEMVRLSNSFTLGAGEPV